MESHAFLSLRLSTASDESYNSTFSERHTDELARRGSLHRAKVAPKFQVVIPTFDEFIKTVASMGVDGVGLEAEAIDRLATPGLHILFIANIRQRVVCAYAGDGAADMQHVRW